MQAIKEKLNDMSAMRKAKAEAREEEKAEKELAKARIQVAHEVRMAREAEAAMDLHVNKAAEKVAENERKYGHSVGQGDAASQDSYGRNPNSAATGHSTSLLYDSANAASHDGTMDPYAAYGRDNSSMDSTTSVAGTPAYTGNRAAGPSTNLL